MHRGLKRFLYGLLYLVVLSALIAGVYFLFLKPAPTCFDLKLNQDEEEIDCGGVCAKDCAIDSLLPLVAPEGVQIFPLDENQASVLVRVENKNVTHGARLFAYRIVLSDEEGTILKTLVGESFVHAAGETHLFLPMVEIDAAHVARAEFFPEVRTWMRSGEFPPANLEAKNVKTVRTPREVRVEGVLENHDAVPIALTRILALFYDASGFLIGASGTEADNLVPAERRAFTILRPLLSALDPARTRITIRAIR